MAGEPNAVTVEFYNAGTYPVTIGRVSLRAPGGWTVAGDELAGETVAAGDRVEALLTVTVDSAARPSQPYFLERPMIGAHYDWSGVAPEIRGRPFEPPILNALIEASIAGVNLVLEREVTYRYNDQARGEQRRALRVVPEYGSAVGPVLPKEWLV